MLKIINLWTFISILGDGVLKKNNDFKINILIIIIIVNDVILGDVS